MMMLIVVLVIFSVIIVMFSWCCGVSCFISWVVDFQKLWDCMFGGGFVVWGCVFGGVVILYF